jgi:hypothetical protein
MEEKNIEKEIIDDKDINKEALEMLSDNKGDDDNE